METQNQHSLFVITGANRGFGLAIAKVLANKATHKTTLILTGRDKAALTDIASSLARAIVDVHVIANVCLDGALSTQETVLFPLDSLMTRLHSANRMTRVTLINNAGSTGDLGKKVMDYDPEEIQKYINLNIGSYMALVTDFIRHWHGEQMNAPEIAIVNISSLMAVQPFPNWGLYASGKSARDMFLRVVAAEHKSVRALSYAPGPLDNEMQRQVRESLGDEDQKTLFTKMANEGQLVEMETSAHKLISLLEDNKFQSGDHIDFYDTVE
ncbi:sepiapterin reductase [Radiomyces spectabilis]|uniref:sepiapterin reductase n=1 Tax=Radiomyces spectabilis TaxID=64574 RepID=UPI00221ED809|nr:sepiapterin reductase [Radiomyces spectabilis]KAI8391753.1 sepiapterin reductase [Radiomyces spectabilis]